MQKQEHKCGEDEVWSESANEGKGGCVKKSVEKQEEETLDQCTARVREESPEMTDEQVRGQCTSKPSSEEKSLGDKLIAVMKEYTDASIEKAKENTKKRIAEVRKELEDELVESIRVGVGLKKDPVIHLSEIDGFVRKIMLDKKPHGKRTITDTDDKPTAGAKDTKKVKSSEEIYEDLMKNKGAL